MNHTESQKLTIAVIFGGRSGEHDVSLMSASSIISALDRQYYEIVQIYITQEGKWLSGSDVISKVLSKTNSDLFPVFLSPEPENSFLFKRSIDAFTPFKKIDVFFPIIHGTYGEDGCLQGLFELANVAYVGAGVTGSALGMDKALFKDVMRTHLIPVVDSITVSKQDIQNNLNELVNQIEKSFYYPVFVKPVNMGSSVGVSKCKNHSDLLEGILEGLRYDQRVLIEKGIDAREIEVSVLGNMNPKASNPGEIIPSEEFYSYKAKYIDESSKLIIPANITSAIQDQAKTLAVKAFTVSDCSGMARVDFLMDKNTDELFLNEINTIPGFTKISMYPKLWEASGIAYPDLLDQLIHLGLERKQKRDELERVYKG